MNGGELIIESERRRSPRVTAVYPVTFEQFSPEGAKVCDGVALTVNISEQGILLETKRPLEVASRLLVTIACPLYTVVAQGDIVHVQPLPTGWFLIGVRLEEMIAGTWEMWQEDVQEAKVSD